MRPAAALFFFTLRQSLFQKKIMVAMLLLAAPAVIAVLMRNFSERPNPWDGLHGPMQIALISFGMPLVCLLYGSELIGTEVESRTTVYLLTRRLRRSSVLLVRYASVVVVLSLLFSLATLGVYAAAVVGVSPSDMRNAPSQWAPLRELVVYLGMVPLTAMCFVAVFVLLGLAASKPLGISIAYFVIVESVVSNLPLPIRSYSILHFVRQTFLARIPGLMAQFNIPRELRPQLYAENSNGMPELIGISVVAMVLACVLVSIRELVPAKLVRE